MTGRCAHTHTHTHRQTNTNERIISAIHFVHLAEIIKQLNNSKPEAKTEAKYNLNLSRPSIQNVIALSAPVTWSRVTISRIFSRPDGIFIMSSCRYVRVHSVHLNVTRFFVFFLSLFLSLLLCICNFYFPYACFLVLFYTAAVRDVTTVDMKLI